MVSKFNPIPEGLWEEETVSYYGEDIEMIDVTRRLTEGRSLCLDEDEAFYVMNLGCFVDAALQWKQLLPGVHPFFAVKANDDPVLIYLMKELNFGFDCASLGEIQTVVQLGVHPSKIIYANTHKQISHLRKAALLGVDLATFDDESELFKIKEVAPNIRLLLRLSTVGYANTMRDRMTKKFGCFKTETKNLLETAKQLGLNVKGVCFHIGIGAESPVGFSKAIIEARRIFSEGLEIGFKMNILDIGGGFPCKTMTNYSKLEFKTAAETIRESLNKEFPNIDGTLQIIAEPGLYFTKQCSFLVTNITGKRKGCREKSLLPHSSADNEYFINDGTYSSFLMNSIVPQIVPVVQPVDQKYLGRPILQSKIWGQSCADDVVMEDCELPDMEVGDWLYFKDKGAYSATMCTKFNGFQPRPVYRYICKADKMPLDAFVKEGGFKC